MAEKEGPSLYFVREEIESLITTLKGREREFSANQDVQNAIRDAIDALRTAEDTFSKQHCFPTWFFMR
jgi:hypothetical protein